MSSETPAHVHTQDGPLLVVVSGPSGVGKDTTLSMLRKLNRPWHFAVTATTRPKRLSEMDGVDYIFLEPGQFQEMVDKGEFLEHAQVYGNRYGVPEQQVREAMGKGLDTILKVDVQGAATIKKLASDAVFIFLVPASMEELERRLNLRATESARDLARRMRTAKDEMERAAAFDYKVVNRDGCIDETVACIDAIITAEKCRITRRQVPI